MSRSESQGLEAPVAAWPHMMVLPAARAIRITGKYLAPSGWWQQGFPCLMLLASPFLLPASCSATGTALYGRWIFMPGVAVAIFIGAFIAALAVIIVAGRQWGRTRKLNITITPDTVHIGRRRFPRRLAQYAVEPHELAREEQIAASQVDEIWWVYRDAVQVVMHYGERRIPVADFDISSVQDAAALRERLVLVDTRQWLEDALDEAQEADDSHGPDGTSGHDEFGPPPDIR